MTKTLRSLFVLMTICLLPLAATAQTTYYVKTAATGTASGDSWDNATTLSDALAKAKAKDQIWVEAGTYRGSFSLKSGISLYGGFAGTESSIDERAIDSDKAYRMTHQTILSGDVYKDDEVDGVNLIFPANHSRDDNATHVLTINLDPTGQSGNNNTERTVVDGITIKGGHAGQANECGGGIYVMGSNNGGGVYTISRCFFIENYATQGGALYVSSNVSNTNNNECLIDRCGFFNNAAGQRGNAINAGGAIYLAGAGTVVNCAVFNNENGGIYLDNSAAKVINSTVTRNTASGIDGTGREVRNTVIWGNSTLSSDNARPNFQNCAYPEANAENTNTGNNVHLAAKNNEENGPHFSSPSLKTGFDTDFTLSASNRYPLWTWEPIEATPLVDAGDSQAYDETEYGNVDLNGDRRIQGTIDIGAFEYQPVSTSRIRYVKQGGTGDGTSWENASGDLQRMIDELADNNPQGLPGEVWVAAGTYEPQSQLIQGTGYSASFRMRDGISVYGGFDAVSPELSKTDRKTKEGGMPWEFQNQTVLMAAYYVRNESNPSFTRNKWTLTSDSRHVVWFAPMPGEETFTQPTYLDGVTITGGYAQGGTGLEDFKTDQGAGAYMDGSNTYLTNCVVKENYATGNGGGIYLKDGRVQSTLIYNNNADQNGGAVYVDDQGLVHRSMLTNNSARNGAGAYLDNQQPAAQGEEDHPEYLILSTCVVSNNTASGNGAIYCDEGGVLLQNTITNNQCVTATDATNPNASQTGGIYINRYALVANSVIWNNRMSDGNNIPMYAKNPTADKVRFMYNAISGVNNAVWNNTLQEQTLSLVDQNQGKTDDPNSIGPRFEVPQNFDIDKSFGIQESWKDSDEKAGAITYFWKPVNGSNLWARGMALGQLPSEVVIAPEIDIEGSLFAQKPGVGAFHVEKSNIVPALEANGQNYKLVLYVDADCTEPEHDGSSWEKAYRSINDAISYFAGLSEDSPVSYIESGTTLITQETLPSWITSFEIRVLEGDLWPRYAFVNEDPKTATLGILKMQSGKPLKIVGGYYRNEGSNDDVRRDPLNHRSQLNGNPEGDSLDDGLYHVVTVESGANVELDGFHVINGYAAGTATLQYGAGMLVHDNAEVTLTNCIFENNTAVTGAAIDARNATLTMRNCVVNNNTNTEDVKNNAVINSDVDATTMQHVTIVNNTGAAVVDESFLSGTSFSKGNDAKNSIDGELATTGKTGAANFANPTNGKGATLGFNTYLGGYASFRPLTSSPVAAKLLINKVTNSVSGLDTDIMGNERDLGGVPDLGAYEADLPKAGKVIYVRSYNTKWDGDREESDGNPNMDVSTAGDGSSWEKAINGNAICDLTGTGISGTDAGFYINGGGSLRKASHDYTPYTTENKNYGPTSGSYGSLWDAKDNQQNQWSAQWGCYYNKIGNKRYERYISGLQYAVEKAAEANANLAEGEDSVEVWVAAGIYTDYKGFVIRDRVRVLGGFPATGTPGESDRKPLLSDYIAANKDDANLTKSNYETILQVRKETPITWSANRPSANDWFKNLSGTQRHYTLYQPDECLPTWNIEGNNDRGWRTGANQYRYPYNGNTLADTQYYHNYKGATWDGFTVRHGYIKNYTSNRDGGAGVRAFRGVTLQNLVIVNNCNHNESYSNRNRGGGLYMDSDNGSINNSFIMQNCANYSNKGDNMGGGAYIIVGTGYNLVVANNYSAYEGGGIFIESATFYNNTVAFNYAQDGGSGLFQYQDPDDHTRASSLTLYNCLFYGNEGSDAISTTTVGTFNEAYNCYVAGNMSAALAQKFTVACGNQTNAINGTTLPNPFEEDVNAQASGNYRLAGTSTCVNRGVESIEQNGETINFDLPSTDMDYTNRIKDCTVDIGAYERDNEDTTQPDENGVYYVTWTGFGNASANSPENAACADKLQTVLNAAGTRANKGQPAIVKIAGYENDENGEFVYHANTLSDENNPQSYTFVVPDGVTVMGGYFEGTFSNGVYQNDGWDEATGENVRNAIKFRTMLSATAVPTQGSTITQEVTGYHAVTFGDGDGTGALTKGATIDGVWLIDGSATSMAGAGNSNTQGGGAIVPSGAHVRNCVVQGNTAIEGGGLYLLPGATVSGTAVLGNTADNGGGVYADNTDMTDNTRSHIISCTIADNTADDGGGLFLEDGASMQVNTVIWGNEAPSNKNVSGVTAERYADTQLAQIFGNMNEGKFYPFNDCFVESQEMPSDFENASMQSDEEVYFADELRTLKEFSPLIKHGVMNTYYNNAQGFISMFNVAKSDMQGISRVQDVAERVDAGAFAFEGGILPTDLFTRIFVSQAENVKLQDGKNMLDYLGKSFYTAFSTLEDALAYVRSMRETSKATDDTEFEILVSGGTYKPIYKRGDDESSPTVANDQRLYSFVVPHGVSIYGGFSGTENYITPGDMQFRNDKVTTIPAEDETINSEWSGEISTLPTRELSDFNGNGIKEPWELANQTILSGNINVSAEVGNVYHVLYTDAPTGVSNPAPILLDGLTVMDGETYNVLSDVTTQNEQGRGGGLYSNGVGYTINRCRFMNNFGLRGGAVYVRDARLNVIGSIFAGNGWTDASATTPPNQPARGGAIFIAGKNNASVSLYAVNSLFVNNETIGDGGAIGTTFAEGITSYVDPMLDIMNCTFAKNKAKMNAVVYNHNGKSHLTNTLIWGNESERYDDNTDAAEMQISHSASDHDYKGLFGDNNTDYNILLDGENTASNGPRFTRPSAKAGIEGNDATNLWNPSGISVATDKGDGVIPEDNSNQPDAYTEWFGTDENGWKEVYMLKADNSTYDRYSGPTLYDDNGGEMPKKRTIDIGVYEYQYFSDFQRMPAIYVATEESGDGSGENWANATSDLRGAIAGASNPIAVTGDRTIYVRDGEYALERLSGGTAFTASVNTNQYSKGLTIKGSCTGIGLREDAQQDFANQSVIRNHEGTATANLMAVHVNGDQYIRIEGFTFVNGSTNGTGIDASTRSTDSKFTLANSALRMNNTGVNISASSGSILIYNTLFADGGTGLNAQSGQDNITLVNTTFANNKTADMSEQLANVYNSVSWNKGTQHMDQTEGNHNKVFAANTDNADIENGPNFVDPLNDDIEARDYHIRPSLTLLNKGNNQHYEENVLGGNSTATLADERDLGNSARLTDGTIDIGAYEYEAPLQPVVYVQAGLANYDNNDGSSWGEALEDLQGAIDLVGIYAHNHVGENGYVFVSNNVTYRDQLRVSLPNVMVYGGMNNEPSDIDYKNEDGSINADNVKKLVDDLLTQRKGLIEGTRFSTLAGNTTINADGSVLDGFMVTGTPAINNGCLSSSIVNNTDGVTGEANGILYNTLVYGDVNGVKAVNVTATGSIDNVNGNAYNRANVTETNTYVTTDHWKYQLMETSKDIDGGELQDLKQYTDMVGHERDIAGNKRIRNTVDNGCFETWNITPDMMTDDNVVTDTDYPHGQSVVYVRKGNTEHPEGAELVVKKQYTASEPFNPGVLLLEHHAGMRVDYGEADNNVGLSYVIVERDVPASGADMAYAPFSATIENNGVSLKRYDAAKRAAYVYTYNKDDGAWADFKGTAYDSGYGLLLDNTQGTADAHVRFIGNSGNRNSYVYREGEGMNAPKQVSLKKENHSDPWTVDNPGTNNKFTAKENMSWNLFGSPYLCAMNYEDMEYGRVIYGYQNDTYVTVNTNAENTTPEGHIPAGDAIFTQTATLKDKETFAVDPRGSEKSGEAYGSMAAVKLSITHMDNARAAEGIAAGGDVLQLNTVTPDHARDDFDMGTDGVKWMADSVAQIYALQGGSRYSLLSAVNVEGKVSVGVTLPAPGLYTIQVPEDCLAEGYETIVLEDANTGKAVNLLEGGYDFSSATAGDIKGRFSISFNRMADDRQDDGIRAYSLSRGTIRVEGVAVGDRVSVYRTDGIMAGQGIASSTTEDVSANVSTVAIVKVERDGKTIAVKKIRVD